MKSKKWLEHLPTVATYFEKRKKAKLNRMPKHLRPLEVWPLWIQLALNSALIIALFNLMVDRDDFLTEAAPAIALVICFLILVYTLITAIRLRRVYAKIRGQKLATINLWLMIVAFLFWSGSIVVFLPYCHLTVLPKSRTTASCGFCYFHYSCSPLFTRHASTGISILMTRVFG